MDGCGCLKVVEYKVTPAPSCSLFPVLLFALCVGLPLACGLWPLGSCLHARTGTGLTPSSQLGRQNPTIPASHPPCYTSPITRISWWYRYLVFTFTTTYVDSSHYHSPSPLSASIAIHYSPPLVLSLPSLHPLFLLQPRSSTPILSCFNVRVTLPLCASSAQSKTYVTRILPSLPSSPRLGTSRFPHPWSRPGQCSS
jgi:hypothetical protein